MSGAGNDKDKKKLLYKSDSTKRRNISMLGSLGTHIVMVLLLSFAGVFQPLQASDDITEVAVFGGGGGGGSEGEADGSIDAAENTPEPEESIEEAAPEPDTIYEKTENTPSPQNIVKKAAAKPKGGGGKGTGYGLSLIHI